jgi:hypothetical protein
LIFIETLKLVQMNKRQQSRERDLEGLIANLPFILRTSPAKPTAPVNRVRRKKVSRHAVLILVPSLGAVAMLFYLLRGVPTHLLLQELEGLGTVICALAYVGIFLWFMRRALAQDAIYAEALNQTETLGFEQIRSNGVPQQDRLLNLTRGCEPLELELEK